MSDSPASQALRPPRGSSGSSGRGSSPRRAAKRQKLRIALTETFDGAVLDAAWEYIEQCFSGNVSQGSPSNKEPTPSAFARCKVWNMFLSQPKPRFLAYRGPLPARPLIPLVLVHEAFSKFALDLEDENLELSEDDHTIAEGVYELFCQGFEDEVREMNKGLLSQIFQSYLKATSFTELGNIKMDGYMEFTSRPQPHGIFIVFEDKTDDGPNGYMEGLEICRRLFDAPTEYSRTISHGILVLRSCPYIILVALIMDRKANVLLSEPLAHIPFWGPEYQTKLQGAKAMRALRNFSDRYECQSDIVVNHLWPIAKWQNVTPLKKDGMVFSGTFESKCMVAKFTQNYSFAAHEAWYNENLAPQLHDSKGLGAGWKFVTMDYLAKDKGWHSVADVPHDDKLKTLLEEFLKKGHKTGYVHGDFRPPNLLIDVNDEIRAIDFEWSGREGVARYPVQLNPEHNWEPTARRGEMLKKIHDQWHVNKIREVSCSETEPRTQLGTHSA